MTVTLFENLRAVFYAPFYAAHSLGAYKSEGVDVDIVTSPRPARTASALLSGEADVSWGGPMRILLTYDQEPDCDLVGFAEVVTRDPFFLVGSQPRPEFTISDLLDFRVATVSEVPTPWLCLQDDMRRAGLDPAGVDRVPDQTMAENSAALRDGSVDAVQLYQPYVEELIGDGTGHIWYAAATRGPTAYTTLYATRDALTSKRETMLAMTRAIYRTLKWVQGAKPAALADAVTDYFPDLAHGTLAACMARYQALGIWGQDPILPRQGFERLKAACLSGGLIKTGTAYETCVDNSLAEIAIAEDPPSI